MSSTLERIIAALSIIIIAAIIIFGVSFLYALGLMASGGDNWIAFEWFIMLLLACVAWIWLVANGAHNGETAADDEETTQLHYDEYNSYIGMTIGNKHYDKFGSYIGETIGDKEYDQYGSYKGGTVENRRYDKFGSYDGETIGNCEYDRNGKFKGTTIRK